MFIESRNERCMKYRSRKKWMQSDDTDLLFEVVGYFTYSCVQDVSPLIFMLLSNMAIGWDYIVTYIVHISTAAPALIWEKKRWLNWHFLFFQEACYSWSHAALDKHKGKLVLSAACMLGKKDGFMKADRVGFSAGNRQLQSHRSLHHFMLSHRTTNVKQRNRQILICIQIFSVNWSSQRKTHRAVW